MSRLVVHGHLGELIQGRLGPAGPVVLVTLPSPRLRLVLRHAPGDFALHQPLGQAVAPVLVRRLFARLGRPLTGRWRLLAGMPVGAGAGASTAGLLAFARALCPGITPGDFAALALALEGASDPLAHPAPERLLWASRQGRVMADLPPLPPLRVVGGFDGLPERTDPADDHFPDIADLVARWPGACGDPAALGALITESSRRSMALRGRPGFATLADLAARHGAYGAAIAHTGAARGFLLPPARDPAPLLADLAAAGWTHVHSHLTGASDA